MLINHANLKALGIGLTSAYNQALGGVETHYADLAMITQSGTAEQTYPWLGALPRLREWLGSRIIHGLEVHGFTIVNRKFENTIAVRRVDIEDDQVGESRPEQTSKEATNVETTYRLAKPIFVQFKIDGVEREEVIDMLTMGVRIGDESPADLAAARAVHARIDMAFLDPFTPEQLSKFDVQGGLRLAYSDATRRAVRYCEAAALRNRASAPSAPAEASVPVETSVPVVAGAPAPPDRAYLEDAGYVLGVERQSPLGTRVQEPQRGHELGIKFLGERDPASFTRDGFVRGRS